MENLQVHRYVVKMSVYSTCHRLHLAAIHEQGKWVKHFQHALELREDQVFLQWNGVWLSDTYTWDTSNKGP